MTTPLLDRHQQAPEADRGCAACPHAIDGHDDIALRFCRATVASALDRGCVCRTP